MPWRERLRQAIAALGSQADFARRLGVSPSRITSWLSGETSPSEKNWAKIVEATGRPRAWFYAAEPAGRPTMASVQSLLREAQQALTQIAGEQEGQPFTSDVLRVPVCSTPPTTDPWPPAEEWMPVLLRDLSSVSSSEWDRLYLLPGEALGMPPAANGTHVRYLVLSEGSVAEGQVGLVWGGQELQLLARVKGMVWPPEGLNSLGRVILRFVVEPVESVE
ncbi:MAG: helix-turn-helix domain-containing protein [Armatimonadota bacterium]